MSNDKLWKAAMRGEEAEAARLIETPEGLAGLEYRVCAAAALPSPPPTRRVAPSRRAPNPSCHRLALAVGRSATPAMVSGGV